MPRAARKPAFDLDRDVQADAPAEPTPPAPLLPKLDDDLPPLGPATGTKPSASRPAPAEPASRPERAEPTGGETKAARPRGTGGRAPAAEQAEDGITKVPARVPADLYAAAQPLVKGVGKPSWGQLVAWTCQDHKDEVVATILEQAKEADRRPRGQNQQGTAGLQVTARLLDKTELPALEEVSKSAAQRADRKVTRTMVLIAALTVATRHASS